jgi:hypothetical protein
MMTASKPIIVSADPNIKFESSTSTGRDGRNIPYREAIGCLMFAAIVSRPVTTFVVSYMSRFVNCYDDNHWSAVKRIIKYLKNTADYGIEAKVALQIMILPHLLSAKKMI